MAPAGSRAPPLVSVIIPVYNGERYIEATIRSVIAQTEPSWEIIAVNDGSKDKSLGILIGLAAEEPRLHVLSVKNGGVSRARNAGVAEARGKYLAFVDQDDLWAPEKLACQLAKFRENPEPGSVFTNESIIDHTGTVVREKVLALSPEKNRGMVFDRLVFECFMPVSSVMMTKELFDRVGGFDPQYGLAEDYDLFLKAVRIAPVDYVDEPLLLYREHGGSGTHTRIDRIIAESFAILHSWREKDPAFFRQHWFEYFVFWVKFQVLKVKVGMRRE